VPGQASRGRPALAGRPPPQRRWRPSVLYAPLLVRYLIQTRQRTRGRAIERVPQSVMQALVADDWPGNVRELQNVVERALILLPGPVLRLEETLEQIPRARIQGREEPATGALEDAERAHILRILEHATGRSRARARRPNG
jgi:formate hydrogenlyase transcriptional activator